MLHSSAALLRLVLFGLLNGVLLVVGFERPRHAHLVVRIVLLVRVWIGGQDVARRVGI